MEAVSDRAMPSSDVIAAMSPAEANAKLTELQADQKFVHRFLKGASPEMKAHQALMERRGPDFHLEQIVAGTAPLPLVDTHTGDTLTTHNSMMAAGWLKEAGLPDAAIVQAFKGEGVSAPEHAAAVRVKADLLGNKEFTTKYLAGDREAVRQMTLLNIIAIAGAKKAA